MPNWLIILLVFVVGGGLLGLVAGLFDDDASAGKGCLGGALMGGIGGVGCLAEIIMAIAPFVIAVLVFFWLFG